MKKIGIVYAISRTAGEHCKNLVEENSYHSLEIITHECPADEYKASSNDIQGIGRLLQQSINDLATRGADTIIIAANSVHRAFDIVDEYVKKTYPDVRLLSIIDTAVEEAMKQSYKTVSVFGSNSTINSSMYQDKLQKSGIKCLALTDNEQKIINTLITSGVAPDTISDDMKEKVFAIANRLKKSGCDAIILACTELPLIFNSDNLRISVVDTSLALALAAVRTPGVHNNSGLSSNNDLSASENNQSYRVKF